MDKDKEKEEPTLFSAAEEKEEEEGQKVRETILAQDMLNEAALCSLGNIPYNLQQVLNFVNQIRKQHLKREKHLKVHVVECKLNLSKMVGRDVRCCIGDIGSCAVHLQFERCHM